MIPDKIIEKYGNNVIKINENSFIVSFVENVEDTSKETYLLKELCVFICDKDGLPIQDIFLSRYENNKITGLLWSDHNDEDYTHKFIIDLYKEKESE